MRKWAAWFAIVLTAVVGAAQARSPGAFPRASLGAPEVIARLAYAGVDPAPSTQREVETFVRRDIEKYRRIIQLTGARPEGQ